MSSAAERTKLRPSIRQVTYDRLKTMILKGEVRPAERLSEARLAERLGVSRTPLREALMKLEEEGLVTGQRNVGYSVADLDLKTVSDLLLVRQALDACAAELACAVATERDMQRVRDIMLEMEDLGALSDPDPAQAARELELGLKIHLIIAESTGNETLIRITEQIYQKLQAALFLEVLWIDFGDLGLREHREIADAVLSRDATRAAAAARAHVQSSLANMNKVRDIYERRSMMRPLVIGGPKT